MSNHWAQFDHHDTKQCLLSDDEQRVLIKAWQQSGSVSKPLKTNARKNELKE